VSIDNKAVTFDRFDDMRNRTQTFICDCCIECCEIDWPHRLGAEHEGIIALTFAIDLGFHSEIAQPIETFVRLVRDAALEKVDRSQVARVLERLPQRERVARAAVVILRGPIFFCAIERRQRDLLVLDEGIGLQPFAQRREIAQRFDGRARLAHGLRRAIELAQRIGEAQ
jgi:hypothetical protein